MNLAEPITPCNPPVGPLTSASGRSVSESARPHEHGIIGELNREWQLLRHHPAGRRALESWRVGEPALGGFADLGALETSVRNRVSQDCDSILLGLLRATRAGRATEAIGAPGALSPAHSEEGTRAADLARRTVLQLMLPKAVRIGRTQRHRVGDVQEAYAIAISCLLDVIDGYPIERRPARIAANLGLDTLNRVRRLVGEPGAITTVPLEWLETTDPGRSAKNATDQAAVHLLGHALELKVIGRDDDFVAETVLAPESICGPRERLVEVLVWAVERRVLAARDAALLARTYRAGAPGDEALAAEWGCKPAALRQRRRRAIARLERAAGAFLADAAA